MEDSSIVFVSVDDDGGCLQRGGVFVHLSATVSDIFQSGTSIQRIGMVVDFREHCASNIPVLASDRRNGISERRNGGR